MIETRSQPTRMRVKMSIDGPFNGSQTALRAAEALALHTAPR